MHALTPAEAARATLELKDGWDLHEGRLRRRFTFADFREAMAFVNKAADIAERHGHHPDVEINYNRVMLTLFTHDAGGLTPKDFEVAKAIDAI